MRYEKGHIYFKSISQPLVNVGKRDSSFPSKKGIGAYGGVDILYKDTNIPEDKRIYSFIGTKEVVDRDGDVVEIKGMDLENYKINPVVLWGHDQGGTPIGKTVGLTHDRDSKSLIFDIVFASTEKGREVETLVKEGMLNSTSIGFIVKDFEYDEKMDDGVFRLTETELLEISIVNIPANQEAVSAGVKDVKEEETKNVEPKIEQEELRDVIRDLIEDVLEEHLGEKEEPEKVEEAPEEEEKEEEEINEEVEEEEELPEKEEDTEESVSIDFGQLVNLLQEINSKLESKPEPDKEVKDDNTEADSQDPEEEPKESEEAQPDEESSEEDTENHSEESPEDEKPDGSNLVSVDELEDEEEFIIITEEE